MKFCVVHDEATLKSVLPWIPEGIEYGKTGFYLIEIGQEHVAVFIVSPETLFEIDLIHFLLGTLETIHQSTGVLLAPPVLLQLMQKIAQTSVLAKKAAH